MKKIATKILCYILFAATGAAAGVGGSYAVRLLTRPDDMAAVEVSSIQPQPGMDAVQLRVRGGEMEWFDGVRWNTAAAVEELKQNDAAEAESDAWRALAQQRADAKQAQRQEALAGFDREQSDLAVGEKPVVRQPTAPRQPTVTTPTPTQTQTPAPTPAPPPTTPTNPEPAPEWSGDYE